MNLAGIDVLVWVIIAVVVALSQGWKQLTQGSESPVEDEPASPRPLRPTRPARAPSRATARPQATAPPVATARTWRVDPAELETYRRQLARRLEAQPTVPPPIVEVVPPPVPVPPVPAPLPAAAPAPVVQTTPASPWVEPLRNPRHVRQFLIAAEILGPPKGG